tara:strand:+ start:603 stop:830 length:228 start_codon:yes stop_codon:yes gene_type:complete
MEFCKNGKSIILHKELGESDEIFYNRGLFIINQSKLNNLSDLERLSKIWTNMTFKGCRYPHFISNKIKYMEKFLN